MSTHDTNIRAFAQTGSGTSETLIKSIDQKFVFLASEDLREQLGDLARPRGQVDFLSIDANIDLSRMLRTERVGVSILL